MTTTTCCRCCTDRWRSGQRRASLPAAALLVFPAAAAGTGIVAADFRAFPPQRTFPPRQPVAMDGRHASRQHIDHLAAFLVVAVEVAIVWMIRRGRQDIDRHEDLGVFFFLLQWLPRLGPHPDGGDVAL